MGENPFTREGSEADHYIAPGYQWKWKGYGPKGEPRYSKWLADERKPAPILPLPSGPNYAAWIMGGAGVGLGILAWLLWFPT